MLRFDIVVLMRVRMLMSLVKTSLVGRGSALFHVLYCTDDTNARPAGHYRSAGFWRVGTGKEV